MAGFRVIGGETIRGSVACTAAKNAVLPIMAAAILADGETRLTNCPGISDIDNMALILSRLGCKAQRQERDIIIDASGIKSHEMPDGLSKKIRSSIFMLGPLLGRMRQATVTYPGGCEIGMRPIDLHLSGLKALGVTVREEGGVLLCSGANMRPADVHFDYPSVGATENVMLAAVLLDGRTTIHNAAREPEIEDLQNFVNAMGGRISGAGTQKIVVDGVKTLHATIYRPIADRIAAGTLLCAAAITGGEVEVTDARPQDMVAILSKLTQMGCQINNTETGIYLKAPARLIAFDQAQTQPYPGFPTDMQVQLLTLASVAEGTSVIVENVFENRFTHAGDLTRMGANIRLSGRAAIVQGVEKLYGMRVTARDLRGGAALTLAALSAQGETIVENAEYIDRGYERFEDVLRSLGANIERVAL